MSVQWLTKGTVYDESKLAFLTENPEDNYRQQMNWSFITPKVKLSLAYEFGENNVKENRESEESKRMSL